jgi:hypothetical protein
MVVGDVAAGLGNARIIKPVSARIPGTYALATVAATLYAKLADHTA